MKKTAFLLSTYITISAGFGTAPLWWDIPGSYIIAVLTLLWGFLWGLIILACKLSRCRKKRHTSRENRPQRELHYLSGRTDRDRRCLGYISSETIRRAARENHAAKQI